MPTTKQIENILYDFIGQGGGDGETITEYAKKIEALFEDNGTILTAAAQLENEVTSTLMDMTVATVLATLIEEEGGGRSNVSISPMSMEHTQQHYLYEVRNEGMIRHVSIKMREDSPLQQEENWREPSHRHGLVDVAEESLAIDQLKPQAEPKEYTRPIWVIKNGAGSLFKMFDRADAERQLLGKPVQVPHQLQSSFANDPLAVIENRWCLHVDCPTSGCNHDPKLRDEPEATSEAE